MTPDPRSLVELYRARNLPEANALANELEQQGIAARIENEDLQGSFGTIGWAFSPRVLIASSDEKRAMAILSQFLREPPAEEIAPDESANYCLECGAMMGSDDGCPQCGWSPGPVEETAEAASPLEPPMPAAAVEAPAAATANTDSPPTESMTNRQVWLEVMAVLAVAFVRPMASALDYLVYPEPTPTPFWRETFLAIQESAVRIFLAVYLISRSGEPMARFGLDRPRWIDLLIVGGLVFVESRFWLATVGMIRPEDMSRLSSDVRYDPPKSPTESLALVVMFLICAYAEEVAMRGYLITRLERLLKSRVGALLVSTLLFAAYHGYQGAIGFLAAIEFGLFMGTAFLFFRRVWPLALAHALINILFAWPT